MLLRKKPALFSKGVIVPLINFTTIKQKENIKELLKSNQVSKKVTFISVTDVDLGVKCRNLKQGEILLVDVGPVTKSIFEYFYKTASLPPTVEGMNSINLMQMLVPHIFPTIYRERWYHFDLGEPPEEGTPEFFAKQAFFVFDL